MSDLLWPAYANPGDLAAIEAVPLATAACRRRPTSCSPAPRPVARPRRPAVLPDAARWSSRGRTYAELLADVHRYANVLHALGVRRDDAVALIAPNCAELITATLAAQLAGIAAPVNGGLSGPAPRRAAPPVRCPGTRHRRPRARPGGLGHRAGARRRPGWTPSSCCGPPGAGRGEADLPPIDGVRVGYLGALAAEQPPDALRRCAPAAADLAALFHTGGTTGAPKLAAHTHANEVADAWMIAAHRCCDADSVVFAALPLFHVNALIVTAARPAVQGPAGRVGRARWATATPRCSGSSGRSSSTTGSPR